MPDVDNGAGCFFAKMRGELRALESSPFFRQSLAAQGLDLLSYQELDNNYRVLAPLIRGVVHHICGVHRSRTVENPGKADDPEDVAEGALAGGVQVGFDVRVHVARKARRRRNKAIIATAVASIALLNKPSRCNYFQLLTIRLTSLFEAQKVC